MSSREHRFRSRFLSLGCLVIAFGSSPGSRCRRRLPASVKQDSLILSARQEKASPKRRARSLPHPFGGRWRRCRCLTSWVADGAHWLLGKVVSFIDDSTSPDLGADWFNERYRFMIGLAALVLLPMLLIAAIRAVMNQDFSQLLRSFFVYLPVAILGTFVAVFLTQALLAVTDAMSAAVAEDIGGDVSQNLRLSGKGLSSVGAADPSAPSFAIFFGALFLVIRFVLRVAGAAGSFCRGDSERLLSAADAGRFGVAGHDALDPTLVETLVALILSKFVIVAVISLATAALADPGGGGFGSVMGAAALMLMAAFSPMAL